MPPIPPRISFIRLLLVTCATAGVNFGAQAAFVIGTPVFVELGLNHFWTSMAWLAGPISGFVVQLVVGVYSDRCQAKWGRRRPYIVAGQIVNILGMLMFANATSIASGMFHAPRDGALAITIAIVAFWILWIGNNMVQGPGWALVLDVCPPDQQKLGNSMVAFMGSLFGLIANLLGFADLVAVLPFFRTNFQALVYLCTILMAATALPTIFAAREVQYIPPAQRPAGPSENGDDSANGLSEKQPLVNSERTTAKTPNGDVATTNSAAESAVLNAANPWHQLWLGFTKMSKPVFRICLAFFCTCAAYTPYLFFITDFFGEVVYHGDPTTRHSARKYDRYSDGVRVGSLALALNMAVSTGYAAVLPAIMNKMGAKGAYAMAHVAAVVCLLLPLWPAADTPVPAVIIVAFMGTYNATLNSVPYALLGMSTSSDLAGLYIGVLNTVQVAAQMIINFVAGSLMTYLGITYGMALVGGGFAAVGIIFVFMLIIPRHGLAEARQLDKSSDEKYIVVESL